MRVMAPPVAGAFASVGQRSRLAGQPGPVRPPEWTVRLSLHAATPRGDGRSILLCDFSRFCPAQGARHRTHPLPGKRGQRPASMAQASRRSSGRRPEPRNVKLSKTMSSILRHNAASAGVALTKDGFAAVEALLAAHSMARFGATVEDVRTVSPAQACASEFGGRAATPESKQPPRTFFLQDRRRWQTT